MWRFVHLTDTHLGSTFDGVWNNRFLCSIMPDVMQCLRRDLARLAPDFVLVTGDISSHTSRDAVFAARDFLDELKIPYYPLGGNHDFLSEKSRDWFMEAFDASLPDSDTVYSFTHKGLHVSVLDPWWKRDNGTLYPFTAGHNNGNGARGRWAIPPHEIAWLEEDLEEHRGLPTILALHYPAVPIPQRLVEPEMKYAGHLENTNLLFEVLSRYPQVKAIFSGHLHMHFIERSNGLTQVVTGSLPEYPVEYREIRVHPDRLEIFTHGLSDTSFAARSLIPGHGWTAGQEIDRSAVISLSFAARAND